MRRLHVLVRGLPRTSVLYRTMEPELAQWSNTEELLASLIEVVDVGNRVTMMANSKKGAKKPKPIKVPRPKDARPVDEAPKPERRKASGEDLKALFGDAAIYAPGGQN